MVLDAENYLRRIAFEDEIQINQGCLARLHRKHIQSVPFENLDIHLGRRIVLDLKKIEDKIVFNRRGGFCYELNGLFGALLRQLGFDVKMISARVCGSGKIGREFDHMVLKANLGEEWLVDVGFGDNFMEPIRIEAGIEQQDPAGRFRIVRHDSKYLRLQSTMDDDSGFAAKYLFTLIERQLEDFTEMCAYHQSSPKSSFTRERICSMATTNGRVTLRDQRLIETVDGKKRMREIGDGEEYEKILRDRFGIDLMIN